MYTKSIPMDTQNSSSKKPTRRGRLHNNQLRQLYCLLDMLYTPSELASAVGFARRQVYRVYVPLGCPHERDVTGHVFINGQSFHRWYRETYKKLQLAPNEAYCVSCKVAVPMHNPIVETRGTYKYYKSSCLTCQRMVTRAITNKRENQ
jgi:hypothetical protein